MMVLRNQILSGFRSEIPGANPSMWIVETLIMREGRGEIKGGRGGSRRLFPFFAYGAYNTDGDPFCSIPLSVPFLKNSSQYLGSSRPSPKK